MYKKTLLIAFSVILFAGCSGKSNYVSKYSVAEATDYAMDCNALLSEIKILKAKINNDENLLESFIPNSLLNKEELNEQDILILRERTKSLQLIYTIKQAKNECRALTARDTEVDSNIVKSVKKIKNTTNEVLDVITK